MQAIRYLQNEFLRRRNKNKLYSLRCFARDLEISPGALSQMLSGKRKLTRKTLETIANKLALSAKQKQIFLGSKNGGHLLPIETSQFAVIADWWHFAVLNLVDTQGFQNNAQWIARRLGIHVQEADSALRHLSKLGYISRSGNTYVRTHPHVATTSDIPSAAIRRHHQQKLELAQSALMQLGVQERDFSGITLPMSRARLDEGKALVKEFRRRFLELMQSDDADEVFTLSIQLFPLTKKEDSCLSS